MGHVGIIANPASGKDIRRLVAYGTVVDNLEKVNIVRRVILSLAAAGVRKVTYMPEYYGIVAGALENICSRHRPDMEFVAADICVTGTQVDSFHAADAMASSGVNCIITLGGDGTNRLVAKGCRDVPILPISTGTNNVFPTLVEGTIAGLAAAVVARGLVATAPAINPSKKLVIYKNGQPLDSAIVDAVVLKDTFIGSRAVWDVAKIRRILVTRGEPHNIGISSIVGNFMPVTPGEARGVELAIGAGSLQIRAPIAPGLIECVPIQNGKYIKIGEVIEINEACVIALDGEREVEVRQDEKVQVQLTFDGPKVVDAAAALRAAVAQGYSCIKDN
ncbi:ATP-NAD kinase family protein [Sporomusa acidovorans]|uniref:ATP-NAD kinase n=1 Tax=Sporomusa acidovorans (strain ATCC 49682 / DSM 3132 / Mol) TaxID=1123286 RepID=A0ABZ3J537_SPOA4|nr:NAD(+)/NADH kinase [Sporomusa acidovorans]OZC15652.1 ATP-NAD kinase [Sporomusa acidovorans DSM 3132]SDE88234.1 Predicted polyphosphate-or ATP-dependent NAD kinase [Sporomusa acidovorans]